MSLTNPSQLLLRNTDLLKSTSPLFVNLPDDGFIDEFLTNNSVAQLSCYNNNYIDYQAIKNRKAGNIVGSFTSIYQSDIQHDLVIISFPKSKAELNYTLAMINPYLCDDALILIVGEKKGGIQSTQKLTQNFLVHCVKVDAARHCLLFAGQFNNQRTAFIIDDWFKHYQITVNNIDLTIASLPGVFSQQKLDLGTALLLENLPKNIHGNVLDFGCGAGVISCYIGKKYPNIALSLLDVSALAITSAKKTLQINALSGTVFASNSLSEVKTSYQHVVSNPPFHQGIKTNYQATEDFLKNIKTYMQHQSTITIVANSFLRYSPIMTDNIGKTKTITKRQGFTIYQSTVK